LLKIGKVLSFEKQLVPADLGKELKGALENSQCSISQYSKQGYEINTLTLFLLISSKVNAFSKFI
jgi:hypothetical protein